MNKTTKRSDGLYLPLTDAQRNMAAAQVLRADSTEYNVNLIFSVEGEIDKEKLKAALGAAVERHRIMRTYYVTENGETVQKLRDTAEIYLEERDVAEEDWNVNIFQNDKPYDLENDPLYRFALLRHGEKSAFYIGVHHIIMDYTGCLSFFRDIEAYYNGTAPKLLTFDYLDYAAEAKSSKPEAADFFRKLFEDGVPQNEMPIKKTRGNALPQVNKKIFSFVSAADIERLRKRTREQKTSVFTSLLAAVGLVLGKYTNSDDVVIGTTMSGRADPRTKELMGMFANTLPVRLSLSAENFDALLKETDQRLKSVRANQDFDISEIINELVPEIPEGRNPLFDVMVNYIPNIPDMHLGNAVLKEYRNNGQSLAVDLSLEFKPWRDGMRIELGYADTLYDDAVMTDFSDLLLAVIGRIIDGENDSLCHMARLTATQEQRVFQACTGLKTPRVQEESLVSAFQKTARSFPNRTALADDEGELTYAALDALSDKIASALAKRGAGRGRYVGVLLPRSRFLITVMLAVLKTGAAYVPLDPMYPRERLRHMLADSGALLTVTVPALAENIEGSTADIVQLQTLLTDDGSDVPEGPKNTDITVLIYTSGTTGLPKGVMVNHGNLLNFSAWVHRALGIDKNARILAHSSCCFDASLYDIWPTLTLGASLHIVPEEFRTDMPALESFINRHGVTSFTMTTQLGKHLIEMGNCKSVQWIMLGGEALQPFENPLGIKVYNGYGPSECTICASSHLVHGGEERIPIGKPNDNTNYLILDRRGEVCPVGVMGELYIAGRCVTAGYLNNPEKTAESFLKNPFAENDDYATMYKTGDLVRLLPNGETEYIGRGDGQVKIRGYRIELGEISNRILQYPGVKEAVVAGIDDPAGGKCAVAYIIAPEKPDLDKLSDFILQTLPGYMLPSHFIFIDQIPYTPNGKTDYRKLPKPDFTANASAINGRSAAATVLETEIAAKLTELLGHPVGDIEADLVRCGLHSLSMIKLLAWVGSEYGTELKTAEFMRRPTILFLENAIIAHLRAKEDKAAEAPRRTRSPLSQNQLGIYYECCRNPQSTFYNVPMCISLPAAADPAALCKAVDKAISAHPVLCSKIEVSGEEATLIKTDAVIHTDLVVIKEEEAEAYKNEFVQPFDFARGPLCRARVVQTPASCFLLLDAHHIVFDGLSAAVLTADINSAYQEETLPAEGYSAFDFGIEEKEYLQSAQVSAGRAYFGEQLKSFDNATEIAGDLPATDETGLLKEAVSEVDDALLAAFCRKYEVSATAAMLAAATYVIGKYSLEKEVYISTISAGRSDAKTARSIGMFVRTLPLCVARKEDMTAVDFVREAAAALNGAVAHEDYPFTYIAEEFHYGLSVMFASELGVMNRVVLCNEEVSVENIGVARPKFKLSIHAETRAGKTVFALQYDDAVYSLPFIERMCDYMATALKEILSFPERPAAKISLLNEARQKRVRGFSPREYIGEEGTLLITWREAKEKYAERTAVIAVDGELTYGALDALSDAVAAGLWAKGARRGDRIGYMLRRTTDVPVAILGILKAGCAFIPIDPDYPGERIDYIIEDSSARFLLTTAAFCSRSDCAVDIAALKVCTEKWQELAVTPADDAYLIYTSGSTGRPKGVIIPHRGIANYMVPVSENAQVHAIATYAKRLLSITTISFDMFLKECLGSILNGVTLVLADEEQTRDPLLLCELFRQTGADAFNATPSRLLEFMSMPELKAEILKCNVIMTGAEKYPPELIGILSASGAHLFNGYGPTETTITSNAGTLAPGAHISVGPPQFNVVEYIVDDDMNELPVGVPGELLIGGRGVAKGYNGLPVQTAERFIEYAGHRVYKSGDIAVWREDGTVDIQGRNDAQVKLRGLRIELGEIESALRKLPGISTCVAVIRKVGGADAICAYCVSPEKIDFDAVSEALALKLTSYMVPTAYAQLTELPRTPSGKLDYRSLPEPGFERKKQCVAPTNPAEAEICAAFRRVLNDESIGVTDDFFACGGTSLQVTRLVIELKRDHVVKADGGHISYADIFNGRTPRALAEQTGGEKSDSPDPAAYDYGEIEALIAGLVPSAASHWEERPLGNVLLTGASGFLGITVLHELIENETGKIWCLVRRSEQKEACARLKALLFYYFDCDYADLFDQRIFAVNGDLSLSGALEGIPAESVDTVINCAAKVKHFGDYDAMAKINVGGVDRCIDFCQRSGARLIHISTVSVAGMAVEGYPDEILTEERLYFGQQLDNPYILTKFLGERAVLAAAAKGLDAKIMRIGNITARTGDGEFQINSQNSSLMGRLRAFAMLGCYPYEFMENEFEFSPVDQTAKAILLLAKTPEANRVFHVLSNHFVAEGDLIKELEAAGHRIKWVETAEFEAALTAAADDPVLAAKVTSLIAYRSGVGGKSVRPVRFSRSYTLQVISRLGFYWQMKEDYYRKSIEALDTLGFFGFND